MNKRIIAFVIALMVQLSLTNSADAGMFDWLKFDKQIIEISNKTYSNISFDGLYNSIQISNTKPEIAADISAVAISTTSAVPAKTKVQYKVSKTYTVPASAYSSTVDQTDDSPFITASGTYVRDGIVAANFLPLGTRIKIPSHYGDKIFIVEDRMNKRYWEKVDIWFPSREEALQWGIKTITVEVLD